jgi:hypothetical protein
MACVSVRPSTWPEAGGEARGDRALAGGLEQQARGGARDGAGGVDADRERPGGGGAGVVHLDHAGEAVAGGVGGQRREGQRVQPQGRRSGARVSTAGAERLWVAHSASLSSETPAPVSAIA